MSRKLMSLNLTKGAPERRASKGAERPAAACVSLNPITVPRGNAS